MASSDPDPNPCKYGHADNVPKWPLQDARGIFLCYVCERCEDRRREEYSHVIRSYDQVEEEVDGDFYEGGREG